MLEIFLASWAAYREEELLVFHKQRIFRGIPFPYGVFPSNSKCIDRNEAIRFFLWKTTLWSGFNQWSFTRPFPCLGFSGHFQTPANWREVCTPSFFHGEIGCQHNEDFGGKSKPAGHRTLRRGAGWQFNGNKISPRGILEKNICINCSKAYTARSKNHPEIGQKGA